MKNFFNKIKKSIKAFVKAWKTNESPDESKVSNFMAVLNATHEQALAISKLEDLTFKATKSYASIIDPFFDRVTRAVMPSYLIDMYVSDQKPIPHLEVFIHQFQDVPTMSVGQDIRIVFHKKYIGHIIITSTIDAEKIKTTAKEIYAIDTNNGDPYQPTKKDPIK